MEDRVIEYLRGHGWQIIDRHVTTRHGEIDILALDGDMVVAVEVKARRSNKYGAAVESITPRKMERLIAAFQTVLADRGWSDRRIRMDLVAIDPT